MSKDRITDPPRRTIMGDPAVDDIGAGLIALARELWVVIDRVTVLETVLARHGIAIEEVDALQPDEALAARLDARRERLLDTLMTAMRAGPKPG